MILLVCEVILLYILQSYIVLCSMFGFIMFLYFYFRVFFIIEVWYKDNMVGNVLIGVLSVLLVIVLVVDKV